MYGIGEPKRASKKKFRDIVAQLRAAIEEFGGGLTGALANQTSAVIAKLNILWLAIKDAPQNGQKSQKGSRELRVRIIKVQDDLRDLGDSLSVKFRPGASTLSEDRKKRKLLANAFHAATKRFSGTL